MVCKVKNKTLITLELTPSQALTLKSIFQNAPEECDSDVYAFYCWLFNELPEFQQLMGMDE